tara:strand:- start:3273 stop:3437 length:165 start_codon:yes stop_codon:yes gene_type:complete
MNILQNKWMSLACACLNAFFAAKCFLEGQTSIFVVCTIFAVWCGYNFVKQLEAE